MKQPNKHRRDWLAVIAVVTMAMLMITTAAAAAAAAAAESPASLLLLLDDPPRVAAVMKRLYDVDYETRFVDNRATSTEDDEWPTLAYGGVLRPLFGFSYTYHASPSSDASNGDGDRDGKKKPGYMGQPIPPKIQGDIRRARRRASNHPAAVLPLRQVANAAIPVNLHGARVSASDPSIIHIVKNAALPVIESHANECFNPQNTVLPTIAEVRILELLHTKNGHSPIDSLSEDDIRQSLSFGRTVSLALEWEYSCAWCCIALGCGAGETWIRHTHRMAFTQNFADNTVHLFAHTWFDTPLSLAREADARTYDAMSEKEARAVEANGLLLRYDMNAAKVTESDAVSASSQAAEKNHYTASSSLSTPFPISSVYSIHQSEAVRSTRYFRRTDSRLTAAAPTRSSAAPLKVVSFNIWNANGRGEAKYNSRMDHIGSILHEAQADIVALQEVRFDDSLVHSLPPANQASDLLRYLPGYQFAFQPAMSYPLDLTGRVEEGLAIYSRYPILNTGYLLLPRIPEDPHQRILFHAEIDVPSVGVVDVVVSHFSLVDSARSVAALRVYDFLRKLARDSPRPQLFMGDLNATPLSTAMQFLNGNVTLRNIRVGDMRDVWLALRPEPSYDPRTDDKLPHAPPSDHPLYGMTFNTHANFLSKRIDYMYLRQPAGSPSVLRPRSIDVIGQHPRDGQMPSDHVGLVAEFDPVVA
ncbi:hypothetical protein CAOG_04872 [Capsaspora owczarzaki ATCC 30864]|uniref:Endonuclease/exonuclease/phosphatase domain-containing protein n=1 Tax=Capsaspora owczarzaki (strain ATCC 30864) TaxID=595528 RepID=A0A0D2VSS4_CAPO3|nr:hypothetical protein CAOG_04872 [Capsaspora owczarzaki ATCC 30864]KJE94192.1 hypothetical protein CAOG_004872 [Capsaspora owczarzaki ATCC 30864]|eukprot:XP_004347623.2 hypothetical protein CAOG_04872 [Capsaspora owczarzaki ATCC 30864]